nr:MAG TPA: hypothetical protein [Caudoviricetes sp.]
MISFFMTLPFKMLILIFRDLLVSGDSNPTCHSLF